MKILISLLLLLSSCAGIRIGYNPITKQYYNKTPSPRPNYCAPNHKARNTKSGYVLKGFYLRRSRKPKMQ